MKKAEKKPIVTKIVLDLGHAKLTLSTEQAKDLHEILHEMFGEKIVRHYDWYRPWTTPYWTYTTCGSTSTSTSATSSLGADNVGDATVYLTAITTNT